jgi:hypothetical protein
LITLPNHCNFSEGIIISAKEQKQHTVSIFKCNLKLIKLLLLRFYDLALAKYLSTNAVCSLSTSSKVAKSALTPLRLCAFLTCSDKLSALYDLQQKKTGG